MDKKVDYNNLTQEEKSYYLEKEVLTGTPEEVGEIFDKLGTVKHTAEAMMYACRFMGLPYVKALTEKGGKFEDIFIEDTKVYACILDMSSDYVGWFRETSDSFQPNINLGKKKKKFKLLPFEERAEILDYLLENKEKTCFDEEKALFYAILMNDLEMYDELKKHGAAFSEELIKILTDGGRSFVWDEYVNLLYAALPDNFFNTVDRILKETGTEKPLNITENLFACIEDCFYQEDFFSYTLEHFNQKKMVKTYIMETIIENEMTALLPIIEKYGWLKMPKKRDEMIDFAAKCKSAECAAWLLDYKNRTADLAKEEKNREKREQRVLNASPDSIAVKKKIWNYKKLDDGTIMITGYKGSEKEVVVPEKIGKNVVSAIGTYAFSPNAPRLRKTDDYNPYKIRREITKVTLPDTVRTIEDFAFSQCNALRYVNIPDGVEKISCGMFYSCQALKEIKLPDSVTEICQNAFCFCCNALKSIIIPDSVKIIGRSAFYRCEMLENVTLSKNIEKLENETFTSCIALESIVIPEGVKEIKGKVFHNCKKLKNVRLPKSLAKITNYKDAAKNTYKLIDKESDAVVEVPAGSYAEKYCKRNEISYVIY